MEPKHGGLEDVFSFTKWAFSGSILVFRGAADMVLIVNIILHSQGGGFKYFCSDSPLLGKIPIFTRQYTSPIVHETTT